MLRHVPLRSHLARARSLLGGGLALILVAAATKPGQALSPASTPPSPVLDTPGPGWVSSTGGTGLDTLAAGGMRAAVNLLLNEAMQGALRAGPAIQVVVTTPAAPGNPASNPAAPGSRRGAVLPQPFVPEGPASRGPSASREGFPREGDPYAV